jgi:hypothetical protein
MTNKSTDQIMSEIEATRAHLRETVASLEEQMTVGNLLGNALVPAREGTMHAARGLGRAVQDNPVAFALTGIGLAWLMASRNPNPNGPTTVAEERYRRVDPSRPTDADAMAYPGGLHEAPGGSTYETTDTIGTEDLGYSGSADDTGPGARERMRERAGATWNSASDAARRRSDSFYRRGSDAAHRASARARSAAGGGLDMVRERPMATAAILVGIGAAAAAIFAVSSSDRRRAIRERGEDLRRRAGSGDDDRYESGSAYTRYSEDYVRYGASPGTDTAAATAAAARAHSEETLRRAAEYDGTGGGKTPEAEPTVSPQTSSADVNAGQYDRSDSMSTDAATGHDDDRATIGEPDHHGDDSPATLKTDEVITPAPDPLKRP